MSEFRLARPVRLALSAQTAATLPSGLSIGASSGSALISSIGFDAETPEQISIYCPALRAWAAGTRIGVRYKLASSGTWSTAHDLLPITPSLVPSGGPVPAVAGFAGAIFDLSAGFTYDVELTIVEPGQATAVLTSTRATRALPAAAGAATKTATTADSLQTKFNSLVPGDVLVLAAGTYNVSGLQLAVSGTSGSPIYIRGASRTGVIIRDTTDAVLFWRDASHVILEDLTLEGSSVDSGTAATSSAIIFDDAFVQTNATIRRVTANGVDKGVKAYTRLLGCLIYDCTFNGNNTWDKTWTPNPAASLNYPNWTWNDDGLCIPGQGNCAWNNTLIGFGDTFASYGSVSASFPLGYESVAVYFYRNRVERGGDDTLEADASTRNIGLYDNWIANTGTLVSADAVYGGPLYVFRNVCINFTRYGLKLSSHSHGTLVYNNTFLRTDNGAYLGDYGLQLQFSDPAQYALAYVNNVLVHRGADATLLVDTVVNYVDWHHNAWYSPTQSYIWLKAPGGTFSTLAAAVSGLGSRTTLFDGIQRHVSDVLTVNNPWVSTVTIGSDFTTEYTGGVVSMALSAGAAKNSGFTVSGITDGYTGAAPDMGAVIAGRGAVQYGDQNGASFSLVGNVWTPRRDGAGEVLQADFDALPSMQWVEVGGATNTLRSFQQSDLPTSGGAPDNNSLTNPWCGATWDSARKRLILQGGGHGDGHPCSNAIFEASAAKMKFARVVDRTSTAQLHAYNVVSKTFETWSGSSYAYHGVSWPLANGDPSSAHTYHGLEYVPPATMVTLGYSGNTLGGLLTAWPYAICNLDTGAYNVPWWTSDADTPGPHFDASLGWAAKFIDGTKATFVVGDFSSGVIDMATPSVSRWSAEIGGASSFCTVTVGKSHNTFRRANATLIKMPERREWASLGVSARTRIRVGAALDASAADWTSYSDTITLTSSDGSHADWNATNLDEDTRPVGKLCGAGAVYDHATTTAWVVTNTVSGGALYRITGLATNTWTTERMSVVPLYSEAGTLANYHRTGLATFGSVKVLIRVTGVDHPLQVCRIA